MTEEEASAAAEELRDRDAVRKLLYLNSVRDCPELAHAQEYQRAFNAYYRLRQRPQEFYTAFYNALRIAAGAPGQVHLAGLLQEIFDACNERHLSFCSKLLATVRNDAIVFDRNVAQHFHVDAGPLPAMNWIEIANRRYNEIHTNVANFLAAPEWQHISAIFDDTFPQAVHLPDLRKADLIIWAHIGLQLRRDATE